MKNLLFSLALLAGIAGLGNAVLNACGSKFLVSSKDVRYQRLLASIRPAKILIYWKQDESTKKEDRWNPNATKALEKAGHRVEVAFASDTFLDVAEKGDFDVMMMPLRDARQLAVEIGSSSPDSTLLPVLYFPTRRERSEAKKEFKNVLWYPTTTKRLLRAVEKARKAAGTREGRAS